MRIYKSLLIILAYANLFPITKTVFQFLGLLAQEKLEKATERESREGGERKEKQRFSIHFTRLSPFSERDFCVLSSRNEMRASEFP